MKFLTIWFLLSFALVPLALADDFVPEGEEDVTFSANNLTLDGDDTGGNVELQFGETLSETLQWDSVNTRFSLSDSLDLSDNELVNIRIENQALAPVCDGTGEGKIYFNTTDKLTYSCDGAGVWNPFENALNATIEFPVVQARRTTSYTLTTGYTDIDLDTTDLENDTTTLDHDNILRDRIDIGATAMYQIIYGYTAGGSATGTHEARARVRVNDVTILPGSESVNKNYQGEFSTTSASFLANLTDGDFISFQLQRDATVDVTQDEIFFSIIKLEGIKGDPGVAGANGAAGADGLDGADGANGADGDITWEGPWVSQNYTANQAVSYLGSSYVCILNTVSNEDPTNPTYWEVLAAQGGASPGTDENIFTIDQDDTGGDVSLRFGTTLAELLTWDNTNSRFTLSDTLRTTGNLEQDGNVLTLDADNVGAGANTSIVSEQGSDLNGEIRYNATNNEWELSNDGGGFTAIPVASVFYAYDDTGGQTVGTTESTLNIDNAVVSDANYVLTADEVTVTDAGLYRINLNVTFNGASTAGGQRTSIDIRLQESSVNIPGASIECYHRETEENSCSMSIIENVAAGGVIRVRLDKTGGTSTVSTMADGSRLSIERIR